ncbi:MAG: polyisoprenyl-teichoic acid--peptidoglycan teichoic acid transferase [Thermoleophilaceae bacterium]|jgi:LCP family protein required for cell wall assembly|nr:polyisoprenyl-teichoic acid--peptidoglycan teichoic acid transferase [Thermoleophilaceae bacterium]MEA2455387.1 polyisoprenyl-teichoic acid--peptidoglycan teichoic acid transferase [Thermoleophilaceae bacterium]
MLQDIPRPGLWKRLLAAAFLVVFAAAGATAVAAFHEVDKVVQALELGPELKLGKGKLATTDPGSPQTLMILGSDKRPKNNTEGAGGARSDTIMLVRLDPGKEATAIMSLPRDLKVEIPGHGIAKLNAAYELGGPELTLETVKSITKLPINHVVNVHFDGFWRAVNAVGCVYADIDRRYFNDSAEYSYINVQPGYQRMCGRSALQYVRFRHEDTDIVRAARQQDFLRQAKQQITASKLFDNHTRLTKIFGRNTSTDSALRSRSEVLRLLKLALFSANQPIQEVTFKGTLGPSYVETTDEQMAQMVDEFLNVQDTPGPRGQSGTKVKRPKRKHKLRVVGGLEDATGFGKDQALQAVKAGAGETLPALYPTLRLQGSVYAGPPRVYKLRGTDGKRYGAYRMVLQTGLSGNYYGLQGITWRNPPILEGVTEKRTIGRRTYELAYDGDRLRLVAWRTPQAVYWISNTLLLSLDEKQMLAIARSVRAL